MLHILYRNISGLTDKIDTQPSCDIYNLYAALFQYYSTPFMYIRTCMDTINTSSHLHVFHYKSLNFIEHPCREVDVSRSRVQD